MGKTIKIILAVFIIAGLFYYLINSFMVPSYNESVNLRRTLDNKKSELIYLKNAKLREPLLADTEKNVSIRLERLTSLISPVIKEESLILDIQSAVQRGGLELSSITIGESRDPKVSKGASVSLGLNGSYNSLISFLEEIEKFPHIMTIDNLSVSGQGDLLNISMQTTIFYGETR